MSIRIVFIWILIITIVATLICGCECVVKPNCNGDFTFILRDKITKLDLLQGPNARYSIDSINRNFVVDSGIGSSNYIQGRPDLGILIWQAFQSADILYLKLNSADTDTLLLSSRHIRASTCCPSGSREITGIVFNGKQVKQESGNFILEK